MTTFELFQTLKDRLHEYGLPEEAIAIVEEMLRQDSTQTAAEPDRS